MATPINNIVSNGIWVVIPAFNEAGNIEKVVSDVRALYGNVVVVDDGSIDLTGSFALKAGAIVLRHAANVGQGAALQTGLEFALKAGADIIVTFDADGQHDVNDIAAMIRALEQSSADVALGSRFLGSAPGMPWLRRLLLKAAIFHTYLTTSLVLTDTHNGLRAFTRTAAQKIKINQYRMAHASEILGIIASMGLRHVEVPVKVTYSQYSMRKGQRTGDAIKILADLLIGRIQK